MAGRTRAGAIPPPAGASTVNVTNNLLRLLGRVVPVNSANIEKFLVVNPGDVELIVGGAIIDPRAIRLLTIGDAVNVGAWFGAVTPTVGQKLMAASLPVALASDQTTLPPVAELRASTLQVVVAGAPNAIATLTLPAPGPGLFHYITYLSIVRVATAALAGGAILTVTSTNLPGAPTWRTGNTMAIVAPATGFVILTDSAFPSPLKSSVANTATTIVAPAPGAAVSWHMRAQYFTAA